MVDARIGGIDVGGMYQQQQFSPWASGHTWGLTASSDWAGLLAPPFRRLGSVPNGLDACGGRLAQDWVVGQLT